MVLGQVVGVAQKIVDPFSAHNIYFGVMPIKPILTYMEIGKLIECRKLQY